MEEILQPGTTLEGRYRLVSEAAPQDLGSLYRGYDTVDDRLVMILVLPFQVTAGSEVLSELSRTQRAVGALGEPGLVCYEYGGVAEDRLYLVRRHVDGRPLAELMAGGRLDPDAAVAITIALGDLVAVLHRAGMVHGGLSPHCVYVDPSGATVTVSVTDPGLFPALRELQAPPAHPWGRLPYLSPEQAAGEEIHPASDVYVLGSMLYAMLAGRPPFRGADETVLVVQHLRQEPPALDVLVPDLSPALVQIVQKALSKEPAARYRNAGQLAQILRSQVGVPADATVLPAADGARHVPAARRGPVVVRAGLPQVDGFGKGVDWLVVALIIAALLAMLGVVQLWRAVYERYAVPSAGVLPYRCQSQVIALRGHGDCCALAESPLLSGHCRCEGTSFAPEAISSVIRAGDCFARWRSLAATVSRVDELAVRLWALPHTAKSWLNGALSGIIRMPRDTCAGWAVQDPVPGCGVKITGFAARLC